LVFRRRSAAVYEHVADTDRGHHHEALYWAELESAAADELAARIVQSANQSPQVGKSGGMGHG
jgi:hypothetical protein